MGGGEDRWGRGSRQGSARSPLADPLGTAREKGPGGVLGGETGLQAQRGRQGHVLLARGRPDIRPPTVASRRLQPQPRGGGSGCVGGTQTSRAGSRVLRDQVSRGPGEARVARARRGRGPRVGPSEPSGVRRSPCTALRTGTWGGRWRRMQAGGGILGKGAGLDPFVCPPCASRCRHQRVHLPRGSRRSPPSWARAATGGSSEQIRWRPSWIGVLAPHLPRLCGCIKNSLILAPGSSPTNHRHSSPKSAFLPPSLRPPPSGRGAHLGSWVTAGSGALGNSKRSEGFQAGCCFWILLPFG